MTDKQPIYLHISGGLGNPAEMTLNECLRSFTHSSRFVGLNREEMAKEIRYLAIQVFFAGMEYQKQHPDQCPKYKDVDELLRRDRPEASPNGSAEQ